MTRRIIGLVGLYVSLLCFGQAGPRTEMRKPKLVVGIVIDQFRFDYLNRFRSEYTGAFARFYKSAAVFTNAHHEHFPTVTAIGHSTFMSGATPSISGIVNNSWYDRQSGKSVTSVSDETTRLLGAEGVGSSPHRLLASTIGDELKISGKQCKVIGISIKDRSAILPVGHTADGAYWFDGGNGNFISSTFYFKDLPAWVKEFNAARAPDKFAGQQWKALSGDPVFKTMPASGRALYTGLEAAPFGNELIEAFAEKAIEAESLGKHPDTDVLTVSFSANDYVGHAVGPDDPMVHDISLRTDLLIEKFLKFLDAKVGLDNVLIALTADHGVAPIPEVNRARGMPGGRASEPELFGIIQSALTEKYGDGKWIVGNAGPIPYFNRALMKEKKLLSADVEETAATAVRTNMANIFRVFTRDEIIRGQMMQDRFSQRVRNGFYPPRSGDLIVIPDAYWIFEPKGASHGTAFNYDTHVPIIFMGAQIRPGFYDDAIAVNDIAPTIATILQIEFPSGSVGRVLTEMFDTQSHPAGGQPVSGLH